VRYGAVVLLAALSWSVVFASQGEQRPASGESAKYTLAVAFGVVGRIDDAVRAVEQGLALSPKSAADWNLKALLVQTTDPVEAVRCLRRALELDGAAEHIRGNLACALYVTGDRPALTELLAAAEKRGLADPVLALMRVRLAALDDPAAAPAALAKLAAETDGALLAWIKQAVEDDARELAAALKLAGKPGPGWAGRALDQLLAKDVEPEKGWIEKSGETFEWVARMDPKAALEKMDAVWAKRPGRTRFTLALEAMRLQWPAFAPLFVRGLTDADGDVRGFSGTGLAMLNARDTVPLVREALRKESYAPARWCMVEGLARLGDVSVLPELVQMSKNQDPSVAKMAVLFLPALAADEVVPALVDALEFPHDDVRRAAHWTLETLTNALCPCGPRVGTEICVKNYRALLAKDPRAGRAALPMRSLERKQRGLAATVIVRPDGRRLGMGVWALGHRFEYDMEALAKMMPDQKMEFFRKK
jgi:hypothetical protein